MKQQKDITIKELKKRRMWDEVIKWRKVSCCLLVYSIIITGMYSCSLKKEENQKIEDNVLPIIKTSTEKQVEPLLLDAENNKKIVTATITAYCPCSECCGNYSNGITSSGTKAIEGRTIAVDPTVIPYGAKVVIDNEIYIAEDTGGSLNGYEIDLFFKNHDDALKFGKQIKQVTILDGEIRNGEF